MKKRETWSKNEHQKEINIEKTPPIRCSIDQGRSHCDRQSLDAPKVVTLSKGGGGLRLYHYDFARFHLSIK